MPPIEIDIIGDLGAASMVPGQRGPAAKRRAAAMARARRGKARAMARASATPGAKSLFTPAQAAEIRRICQGRRKAKRVGGVPMRIRKQGGKIQVALQTNPIQGIDEICDEYVDTFFGNADGIEIAELGGINLNGVKKGMSKALKDVSKKAGDVGKAATKAVKSVAHAYNKFAESMDVNKGKKQELVAKMNRVKGRIQAIEAKGLKNPKSKAELDKLKKEYATLATQAKKEHLKVEEMEEKQKTLKVAGALKTVAITKNAQKIAAKGGKEGEAAKEGGKKLTPGQVKGMVGELGIAPVVAAAVVGVAAAVAVAAVLTKLIANSGKLEKQVETSEKQINEWESNWKEVTVPFNPENQAYTEQVSITDPATGQEVTAVRVGDKMMMPVTKGKAMQESFMKEVQRQEGNAEGELGKTGLKAGQSLFDEIGMWPIVLVGGLVVLGFGIYIVSKKKKPVGPPQQNPRTIDLPPWAYHIA